MIVEHELHWQPSGYLDGFARAMLPPRDQWPELIFELPQLAYPARLNCGAAFVVVVAVAVAVAVATLIPAQTARPPG